MKNSKTKKKATGSMRGKNLSTGASRAGFVRLWDFVWIYGSIAAVAWIGILVFVALVITGVQV